MRFNFIKNIQIAFLIILICVSAIFSQQSQESLRGQVSDSFGGAITGITVTAVNDKGIEFTTTTNQQGEYIFASLPAGKYKIKINVAGFSDYENANVEIKPTQNAPIDIILTVANATEMVEVMDETAVGTDPDANGDSMVLKGEELEALPDDPEELVESIQALTGASTGIEQTSQIRIDGFSGGRIPPKNAIREIRINNNPFSAEFDRPGYGRVEILTKPGTNKLRGQGFFNFNDESLNSRSPFAVVRAPYQIRSYGGNLSGQIIPKKSSFFFDYDRREVDDNRDITAFVLDSSLNQIAFNQTILNPTRRTSLSPRIDWQLNDFNTIIARYTFEQSNRENDGIGNLNLPSRAYETKTSRHTVQLTETAVINKNIINETRFQFIRDRRNQEGGSFDPAIRVLDAFMGGGAQVGMSYNYENRFELQNFTSWTIGQHSFKAGAMLRLAQIDNSSEQNFTGTYTFGGGTVPLLDANNQIVRDANGNTLTTSITSLERYRRTLLFQKIGLSPTEIRTRGGGATQFSISGGNPVIKYSQTNVSPFVQDDWRVKPNLTLSFGLRYDWQSDIKSKFNFAPRAGIAWSPVAKKGEKQKTVIRGGIGLFYNPFNESLLSQSLRYNGVNQQQYVITTSNSTGINFLNSFPNAPTIEQIASFSTLQTIRQMDENLSTPYTIQSSVTYERQLPYKTTFAVSFINSQTLNALRSRNINAPLTSGTGAQRPFSNQGNIFEYESNGRFNQQQLNVNINNRFSRMFTLSANYSLNNAKSDTDGMWSFPVNQYDLSGEYARSTQDIRHRFTLYGSFNLPWRISLSPNFIINSGRPFNITTGRDTNGDTIFTERPAFADAQTKAADLRSTLYGNFDVNPKSGQTIIPRNYGTGPSFSVVNLRISKGFDFGKVENAKPTDTKNKQNNKQNNKQSAQQSVGKRYNLNLSINIQNLLNNTNESVPTGNLSSPSFGISTSGAGRFGGSDGGQSAGNRRIDVQLRFNF